MIEIKRRWNETALAALIYRASDPKCRVPHFYEMNDARALARLVKNAEQEAAGAERIGV